MTSFFTDFTDSRSAAIFFLDICEKKEYTIRSINVSTKGRTRMNILILYATRGGATRECVGILQGMLPDCHTVRCVDLSEEKEAPSPATFDVIVLGSSIQMGRALSEWRAYVKAHKALLSEKQTAVFFCCGYPKLFDEYVETQIPRGLTCSLGAHCFGGELKPEKRKGLAKLLVRSMRNAIRSQDFEKAEEDRHALPELLPENIALLADSIKKLG